MSHSRDHKKTKPAFVDNIVGTGTAAVFQLLATHPADTAAKRRMRNNEMVNYRVPVKALKQLNRIIFLEKHQLPFIYRYFSLYDGFIAANQYKLLQATYKFAFQAEAAKKMEAPVVKYLSPFIPAELLDAARHGIAGGCAGGLEIFILAADYAKVRKQNFPELKKISTFKLLTDEFEKNGLPGVYRGAGITFLRNVPGSAALFSVPELFYVFNHTNYSDASAFQQIKANSLGAFASLLGSQIQDCFKTRIQCSLEMVSTREVYTKMMQEEGPRALFKGFGMKCVIQGGKLLFIKTASENLSMKINQLGIFSKKHNGDVSSDANLLHEKGNAISFRNDGRGRE